MIPLLIAVRIPCADAISRFIAVASYVSRHSFAMCLREKGVSIDIIGETLGHQSVLTSKAYVRDFGVEVLDEAVEVLLW